MLDNNHTGSVVGGGNVAIAQMEPVLFKTLFLAVEKSANRKTLSLRTLDAGVVVITGALVTHEAPGAVAFLSDLLTALPQPQVVHS